ncbi:LexA family protein [Paenibacillus wenxiniae]|uniref:XRE family transcriptional regulator n=1 Tax=Paenibacillus wenxiniae TaxID=1636843 RepID=A0ABW4RMG5_9BACL
MVNKNDSKLFYLTVGSNIKKYRKIRNYSLEELAERVGLTKKTIHRYENGEIKIDMDRLAELSEALETDISQLLEGAGEVLGIGVEDLGTVHLPVAKSVSIKDGNLSYDEIELYEATPKSWVNGTQCFYIKAVGDSMKGARIFDGDLLLISAQNNVEGGEIAAVLTKDGIQIKRVYKQGEVTILQSENEPVVADDQTKIIGKLKKIIITI